MNVRVEREKHEYELTKEFNRMSKTAQAQLTEKYKADVDRGCNVHFAKLQKHWLILDCIVDHDYMGKTPEEILLRMGNWHEVYRLNSKIMTEEEQLAWFDKKLTEIFGDPDFFYQYLDKLENMER